MFWIIKIFATTLGETGGDAVSMSMNLGYLVGTAIFAAVFIAAVYVQIKSQEFSSRDLLDDDHRDDHRGHDHGGLRRPLTRHRLCGWFRLCCWLTSRITFTWYKDSWNGFRAIRARAEVEMFYWVTIMFSQTLGTALGDWTADSAGLGYRRKRRAFRRVARGDLRALFWTKISRTFPVLGRIYFNSSTRAVGRRLLR